MLSKAKLKHFYEWDPDKVSGDFDLIYSKTQTLGQGFIEIAHLN